VSAVVLLATWTARAQEMEPRAYSPSPIGTNFLAVALGGSHGSLLFDASIPITDASATLGQSALGYARSFGLFGRQALVAAGIPFVHGQIEGQVFEESRRVERSGLADVRVKLSTQIKGPGALTRAEFAKAPRRTIVGVSLTAQAPVGEYDETKLINLGTNRWAFKPEVGVSVPVGRWYLDAYAGAWLFTTNDDFYPGDAVRKQDPLTALQAHASYSFKNRAWVAVDATWYGGGEATVNDGPPSTRQSNTRFGGTFSLPLAPSQSLKIAASTGVSTRVASSFDTVVVGWQLVWFDEPRHP
jgi:hypothetical protein